MTCTASSRRLWVPVPPAALLRFHVSPQPAIAWPCEGPFATGNKSRWSEWSERS